MTNACASPLDYVCLQLPKGVAAALPVDGATYPASDGNVYTVRNPNFSPFYSIRFKAQTGGLQNGQQAVFEYALLQQSAPAYIHVYGKLVNGNASEAHLNTFYCPVEPYSGWVNRNIESAVFTPGHLQIWPNPNNGYLLIDSPGLPEQLSLIRLWNLQGQVVFETRFEAGSAPLRVDLPESLTNGMYYLSVDAAEWTVLRFVLAR